jgi:hypothetical protein
MTLDKTKLLKVLGMTGSAHDGEALAALRTALKMMANANVTWVDIITIVVKAEPKMDHTRDAAGYWRNPSYNPYDQSDPSEILRRYQEYVRDKSDKARREKYKDDLYADLFGKKRR